MLCLMMLRLPAVSTAVAILLLTLLPSLISANRHYQAGPHPLPRRLVGLGRNSTTVQASQEVCQSLTSSGIQTSSPRLLSNPTPHYLISSDQTATCTVIPTSAQQISTILRQVGQAKIPFSIYCGGHTSNPGFSSSQGIQISMSGFKAVQLNREAKTVTIGGGTTWSEIYEVLDGSGYNVVGGRVVGVGSGGFITGGGGYGYTSNQYGLTGDTVVSFDMVLPDGTIKQGVTADSEPDLFWAVRGGGNRFGIVYSWTLQAFPQSNKVWGGLRVYSGTHAAEVISNATLIFQDTVSDKKAAIIASPGFAADLPITSVLAFYDGPTPPPGTFDAFDAAKPLKDGWKTQSFKDIVASSMSDLEKGQRGGFNTIQLPKFTPGIIKVVNEEINRIGTLSILKGLSLFIECSFETFTSDLGSLAKDSAWPHKKGGTPLFIFFAWDSPLHDRFWHRKLNEMIDRIKAQALQEGLDLDGYYRYPNYAISTTPLEEMYDAASLTRLGTLRKRYDPEDVMLQTTWFDF